MRKLPILTTLLLLAACQSSNDSSINSVSTQQYKNYNCEQITKEMQRLSRQIDSSSKQDLAGNVLNSAMAMYYVSQGYGVAGGGDNSEAKRYQAQYNALEQISIEKNCN